MGKVPVQRAVWLVLTTRSVSEGEGKVKRKIKGAQYTTHRGLNSKGAGRQRQTIEKVVTSKPANWPSQQESSQLDVACTN